MSKIGEINEALVTGLKEESLKESVGVSKPASLARVFEEARYAAQADGKQMVDVIDFEYLFEQVIPEDVTSAFASGRLNNDADLRESVASTIRSSNIDRLWDTCVVQIMQDFSCPEAGYSLRDQVTTPINLSCNQTEYWESVMPNLPDLCCMKENESTPYYGIGSIRKWKTPPACKIKFAFGFNREMLCVDPNGYVRRQIDTMGKWFDEMDELALIKIIFGAETCASASGQGAANCRFPFIYNDTKYNLYLDAADSGPWTNLYEDPDLNVTGCCDSNFAAIEKLIELERDPDTGRPIDCMNNLQIMIPLWSERYKFLEGLGPKLVRSACSGGNCDQTNDVQRAGRDGWDTNLLYSRHAYDVLVDYYTSCHENLATNAAEAELWASQTYAIGNFKRALGWGTEWALEELTREGTDTWEYFDREVVYQRKYMRKATPLILGPWHIKLIRGFDSTL